jgi:hypothetical protein
MQRKAERIAKIRKLELSHEDLLRVQEVSKTNTSHLQSSAGILGFLVMWVFLCYQSNMFVREAVISSFIILALVFIRHMEQNDNEH